MALDAFVHASVRYLYFMAEIFEADLEIRSVLEEERAKRAPHEFGA